MRKKRFKLSDDTKIGLLSIAAFYIIFNIVRLIFYPDQSLRWHILTAVAGLVFIFFFGCIVQVVDMLLDRVFPFERNIIRRIAMQFGITLGILFAIRFGSYLFFKDQLLRQAHFELTRELWAASILLNILMVLSIIMAIFGFHFFRRWREEKLLAAELEKEKALVQYDNLKNQLNPHFLFNSLTSLNSLIYENPQLASDFLQQLSRVFRYILENKDKNLVRVATEVSFVTNYVHLMQTRFDGALQVSFSISKEAEELKIVPVTLQVLIENATKHNVTSTASPLCVNIYDKDGYMIIENNLQKKHIVETSNGHGLANLRNLYQFLSDDEVIVEETEKIFAVKIPLVA